MIASAAAALGIAALLMFAVFLWTGSFGLVHLQLGERDLLLWDAGLCLLFFVQHSGMVRKSFRARLKKVLPEYTHGVVYTIASALALFLLVGGWQRSATNLYLAGGAGRWLIAAVLLLALAGIAWGARSLEEFDLFGTRAFLRRGEPAVTKLAIAGPYRWVRHPFYAFGIVALWAAPVLSLDRLLLNSLFTAWIFLGANLEERDLVTAFGEDYRLYQRAVPMFLPWKATGRPPLTAKHP